MPWNPGKSFSPFIVDVRLHLIFRSCVQDINTGDVLEERKEKCDNLCWGVMAGNHWGGSFFSVSWGVWKSLEGTHSDLTHIRVTRDEGGRKKKWNIQEMSMTRSLCFLSSQPLRCYFLCRNFILCLWMGQIAKEKYPRGG